MKEASSCHLCWIGRTTRIWIPLSETLDSAFGDNWMDVPEWRSTERCEDIVKCMYSEQTFRQLLETQFRVVEVWKPVDSTVLFAKSANSPRSRLGRLVELARGFKPVGTRP